MKRRSFFATLGGVVPANSVSVQPGASEDFRDMPFDVYGEVSVGSGLSISDFPIEIRNADAPWFWTGLVFYPLSGDGGGKLALSIQDATGRALSSVNVAIENLGTLATRTAPVGSMQYLQWPRNSRVRINASETTATGAVPYSLLFTGFKRYREVVGC